MSYTISYKGLSKQEKELKALEDVKSWLGSKYPTMLKEFSIAMQEFKKEPLAEKKKTLKALRFYCSFIGISGYPISVFLKEAMKQV